MTYDGIPDTVSLIGVQFGDSNAWQQMSLVIQNGATGRITAIALPDDAAYAPSISLVSLTGKDKRDILLSLPTGGSGGIIDYIIYTYDDGTFRPEKTLTTIITPPILIRSSIWTATRSRLPAS